VRCVYLSVIEKPNTGRGPGPGPGPGPPEQLSHKEKKNLHGSCCLYDVCTLFVLPDGLVFGLCHLFLVLCQSCFDNRIFGNGVVIVRRGCVCRPFPCRSLRTKRDGRTLLYTVTANAVAVPIASNDLYISLNWFCSLFSCACFTAYGRAQLQFDTLLQCVEPGVI